MKKNSILMFLGVIFALTLGFNHQVEAAEGESSLTDAEKDYLYGLNFSKVEVENMPYEELKFLVDSEAEILTSFEEIYSFDEVTSDPSEVTTFGDIPSADMSFKGNVLKLNNSTVSGYNAFYAHANFKWLNKPIFALTDKIAIGFPSSLGVYIPAQSGKLQGFNSTYSLYNTSTGGTTLMSSSTTPSTWDPSLGVAGSFDLSGTLNKFQTHEGTIAQTFYIKSSSSGKATVKFEYGHKKFTGTIGISVLPIGVSITPNQSNVDIRSYAASFSY